MLHSYAELSRTRDALFNGSFNVLWTCPKKLVVACRKTEREYFKTQCGNSQRHRAVWIRSLLPSFFPSFSPSSLGGDHGTLIQLPPPRPIKKSQRTKERHRKRSWARPRPSASVRHYSKSTSSRWTAFLGVGNSWKKILFTCSISVIFNFQLLLQPFT